MKAVKIEGAAAAECAGYFMDDSFCVDFIEENVDENKEENTGKEACSREGGIFYNRSSTGYWL